MFAGEKVRPTSALSGICPPSAHQGPTVPSAPRGPGQCREEAHHLQVLTVLSPDTDSGTYYVTEQANWPLQTPVCPTANEPDKSSAKFRLWV